MSSIANKLLSSCEKLFSQGIINQPQYDNCVKSIAGTDLGSQIKITEDNVFSTSRLDKQARYREFIDNLEEIINKSFEQYNSITDSSPNKVKYENIIIQIGILINEAIDWVQTTSEKRFKGKEQSNYEQVLYYYNQIDNNRKKIIEIEKQFKTLEERSLIQDDKFTIEDREYKSEKNITVALVIFNLITFVIIFLIYFI